MIEVHNRNLIISAPDRFIGVVGDNKIEIRQFEITDPKLFSFDFKLDVQQGENRNIVDLDKTVETDKVILSWLIKKEHISNNGVLYAQLRAFSDNEEIWHSKKDDFRIGGRIGATDYFPSPLPSEFEEMEQRITQAKNEVEADRQEVADNTQTVADNLETVLEKTAEALQSAANALVSEQNAHNSAEDAKASEVEAGKSEANAKTSETNAKQSEINASESAILAADTAEQIIVDETARQEAEQLRVQAEVLREHKMTEFEGGFKQYELKVAKVEKNINEYKETMSQVNVNQEAKQKVTGYGVVSLPKNSANGQVSVSVFGNTETDEEGNTKSTISAIRLKSVGKNLFDKVKCITGKYITLADGTLANGSTFVTDFIEVLPSTKYTLSGGFQAGVLFGGAFYDNNKNYISSYSGITTFTTPTNARYFRGTIGGNSLNSAQMEKGDTATAYEPYTESTQYLPNVGELRSLPNGVCDEISVSGGKAEHIKRIDDDGVAELAEPIITPIQVSGTLLSNPSGTVYVEPVVADAGIYDNGINVLHQDLPIDYIERLSKVDFMTGVETELDVSECVLSGDKLSFTHPDLVSGDILFFTYFYDRESTQGETAIEYYDSRYTLKDDVTGKFYKVVPKVSNGELINELVEV